MSSLPYLDIGVTQMKNRYHAHTIATAMRDAQAVNRHCAFLTASSGLLQAILTYLLGILSLSSWQELSLTKRLSAKHPHGVMTHLQGTVVQFSNEEGPAGLLYPYKICTKTWLVLFLTSTTVKY